MAAILKVDTITNASNAGTANLTLDASGNATVGNTLAMGSSFKRNRIINGDMRVDQRNAGAAVTVNSTSTIYYAVDRWQMQGVTSSGVYTAQRSTTAPPRFNSSLLLTVTTVDSSLAATDLYTISQSIEGFNVADFNFGTANAATITVSFWVRSSVTGTFGGAISNGDFNRSYPFTYTIGSTQANQWVYQTITIPGDTTGTWATDNSVGLRLYLTLGGGSNYSAAAGSWAGSGLCTANGATNLMATNGATFYVTGVQIENGSIATPYERQIYTDQLLQCNRYYWRGTGSATGSVGFPMIGTGVITATTQAIIAFPWSQNMRIVPTLGFSGNVTLYDASNSASVTSITTTYGVPGSGLTWALITASGGGYTGGKGAALYCQNASTNWFEGSAEL